MPRPKFLFINKDAKSDCLTRSSGDQRSAIQKHVQRGLVQNALVLSSDSRIGPRIEADDVNCEVQDAPPIRSLAYKFGTTNESPVPVNATVRALLDYYVYYYQPTIWTYQPLGPSPQPYAYPGSVTDNIRNALQDPLTMSCLLSAAAARITNVDGLPFPGNSREPDVLMQRALCLMQKRITSTNETDLGGAHDLISCMMFLCSAEAYRHNYKAAWTHLRVALRILESKGGIKMLRDKNLQGQLLMSDLALSCINLRPCLCACDFYDPGPSYTLNLKEDEVSQLGTSALGSKLLDKEGKILPWEMKILVQAILDSYNTRMRLQVAGMSDSRAFETTHWVQKRNMAIRNKLLRLKCPDECVHALRTALIMWTLLAMNTTGRVMTVKMMATKLRSIVGDVPLQTWTSRNNEDVKFWILLVGHSSACENSETYAWFSEQILRLVSRQTGVFHSCVDTDSLLQGLITFQQGFLYDDAVQRSRTETLAEWLSWWLDMI